MAQGRLSSLALMHIHYETGTDIHLGEVVDLFAQKHLMGLKLGTLLRDYYPKIHLEPEIFRKH